MVIKNCEVCGVNYHNAAIYSNAQNFVLHCKECWDKHHGDCKRRRDAKRPEPEDVRSKRTFLTLPFDSKPKDNNLQGDAVILVQGNTEEQVYAHKFFLSSRSPVFSKMFDAKMLEEATGTVHINDTTLPVMRAVVKFCYDAEIDFTDEVTVEDVLYAANKYDIPLLRKICEDHLIKTLSNENLPKRLKLSKKLEATGLQLAASKYFKDNFDSLISSVLEELY